MTGDPRHWAPVEAATLSSRYALVIYRADVILRDGFDEVAILIDEASDDHPVVPRSWPDHERTGQLPDHWRAKVDHVLRDDDGDDGDGGGGQ